MIDESDDGMFRDEVRREMICSKFTRSPTRAIFSIHLLSVELASILSTDSTDLFKYQKHTIFIIVLQRVLSFCLCKLSYIKAVSKEQMLSKCGLNRKMMRLDINWRLNIKLDGEN